MREPESTPIGPTRRVFWALGLGVLALHLWVLGQGAPLQVQLVAPERAAPVRLRVLAPEPPVPAPVAAQAPRPRPRAAVVPEVVALAPDVPAFPEPPVPMPEVEASAPESEASGRVPVPAQVPLTQTLALAPRPVPVASAPSHPPSPARPWPLVPLGALPPSTLLHYQLNGMDKGLTYHASGELRWQHNETAYELTLTVRAFLVGSRHWRSVGRIEASGLAPTRFSDSWRHERAAHFDREQQRIVFSSNSQPAALQPGAQDQVSLYVQLAAAMAGEPERFVPGTRLQVQTATVRDAQPWSLTLDKQETLQIEGRPMTLFKWVCQPRNQYESRVEFWVSAEQAWLPMRILITQASGSYIDLHWHSSEPLAPSAPRS